MKTITVRAPAVREAIERVAGTYGELETLRRIRTLFADLISGISTHTLKEEREISTRQRKTAQHQRRSGSGGELVEHQTYRARARTCQNLAQQLPEDVSVMFLRKELRTLNRELHNHMHLENNVLYPRAIEIENELRRSPVTVAL